MDNKFFEVDFRPRNNQHITVAMTKQQLSQIDLYREKLGVSRNEFIRGLIRAYVAYQEDKAAKEALSNELILEQIEALQEAMGET